MHTATTHSAPSFLSVIAFRASREYVDGLVAANPAPRKPLTRTEMASLFADELYGDLN